MNQESTLIERAGAAWLAFWYAPPAQANMALMRVGVGLVMVYVLLLRSYDLEIHLAPGVLGDPGSMRELDRWAWPFSVFAWGEGSRWIWTVHLAGITFATAFVLGIVPSLTGAVTLALHLSYAHSNPAIVLGLDGLLVLAFAYLVLMPTGRRLSFPGWRRAASPKAGEEPAEEAEVPAGWGGLPFRVLQIHLCLLYLQSGLAKLSAGWLAGMALWHPRLVERGFPFAPETLEDWPSLLELVPRGLALFELFYCVFIWLPGFRYLTLGLAVATHLTVGILWDKLPFNLLMIVLNLAFLKPALVKGVCDWAAELAGFAWHAARARIQAGRER